MTKVANTSVIFENVHAYIYFSNKTYSYEPLFIAIFYLRLQSSIITAASCQIEILLIVAATIYYMILQSMGDLPAFTSMSLVLEKHLEGQLKKVNRFKQRQWMKGSSGRREATFVKTQIDNRVNKGLRDMGILLITHIHTDTQIHSHRPNQRCDQNQRHNKRLTQIKCKNFN